MVAPARSAALLAVSERRRRSGRIRDILRASKEMAALSGEDRGLATRLSVGAVAAETVLDAVLNERIRKPSSVEPRVRDALRISAFEICYLSTPSAVAVSEGVELVRSVSPRAAGMANAVLRRVVEEVRWKVDAARAACETGSASPEDMVLTSGIPTWLVQEICDSLGIERTCELCLAQLEAAPVWVTANTRLHTTAELEALLANHGMDAQESELKGTFELKNAAGLSDSGLVEAGDILVCDLAAQLICRLGAPCATDSVLEVGQGRATKTILLASASSEGGRTAHITGIDNVASKVRIARERLDRSGWRDVATALEFDATQLDSEVLPEELNRKFDLVFVDAPCTGTGTMRRHPEIASRLVQEDVSQLCELQLRMFSAAAVRVAIGGSLVYSCCSVLRAECEGVVESFLASKAGANFELVPVHLGARKSLDSDLQTLAERFETSEGYFRTAPAPSQPDGHFCAVLRRTT